MFTWSFWGWCAYGTLSLSIIANAIDELRKRWPEMSDRMPEFFNGPVWAFLPLLFLLIGTAIFVARELRWIGRSDSRPRKSQTTSVPLEHLIGKKFQNAIVVIDGKFFDDCEFENVTFRWNGGSYFFNRAKISGSRRIETFNSVVVSTIDLLKGMGWLDPTFANDWKHIPLEPKP